MLYNKKMQLDEIRDNLELNDIINEIILNSYPVKYYRGDISYDIIRIVDTDRAKKYTEFCWIVREHGTWLLDASYLRFYDDYNNIHEVNDDIELEFTIKFNEDGQGRWSIERDK